MTRPLLLYALLSVVAMGSATARAEAILGFNTETPDSVHLTDNKTGKHYVVALRPDPDVHGTIDAVVLVLTREGGSDQNLLAPIGVYHGLQPYDFAALDFRRGPENSTFGSTRRIAIRRTTAKLVVRL